MKSKIALIALIVVLSGCTTLAGKTNTLSDERIISESAGALGLDPAKVTLVSRTTSGTNTYAILRANGTEYACTINGGNLLTFGMTNPPSCGKPGEPRSSGAPFERR